MIHFIHTTEKLKTCNNCQTYITTVSSDMALQYPHLHGHCDCLLQVFTGKHTSPPAGVYSTDLANKNMDVWVHISKRAGLIKI